MNRTMIAIISVFSMGMGLVIGWRMWGNDPEVVPQDEAPVEASEPVSPPEGASSPLTKVQRPRGEAPEALETPSTEASLAFQVQEEAMRTYQDRWPEGFENAGSADTPFLEFRRKRKDLALLVRGYQGVADLEDSQWTPQSYLRMAQLNEDMGMDIGDLPTPDDLNETQALHYEKQVAHVKRAHLEDAKLQYERALAELPSGSPGAREATQGLENILAAQAE